MRVSSQIFMKNKEAKCIRNCYTIIRVCCILFTAFIFINIIPDTAKAETGLKLYDYAKKTASTYTGKKVTVSLSGNVISNEETPGVLINGIAMLPYDDIFENSAIMAECDYDEDSGMISISKYNTTILLKIGSKNAEVNGKAVTLPVAPVKIKYMASDITKVLVPSRYIATALGLGYTWYDTRSTVVIEKYTKLLSYNGGEEFEYKGSQGNVTVNGKKLSLGSMPSIIIDNTAMLRVKKVFVDSEIKAGYLYDKNSKTMTLSKNGTVLIMTIGSKTAYLNGQAVNLSAAPVFVKNNETGITFAMVPGNFTTVSLGYNYLWNSTTKTSIITSKETNTKPGDSGEIGKAGTSLKAWTAAPEQYGVSSNAHEILNSAVSANNSGTISSVSRDFSNSKLNAETFQISAAVPYHQISSSFLGKKLTIQADNQQCSSQTYPMYGASSNMVNTISLNNNTLGTGITIEFDMLWDNYQYEVALSDDKHTLYVTVYHTAVISAEIGTNKSEDYLILNGTDSLHASVTEASGSIYIDLPYTASLIGDISTEITGSKYIKQFYIISSSDKIQAVIQPNDGCQYHYAEENQKFTITFQPKEAVNTEIDTGKYAILIPKPETVTSSMILDEDNYFKNCFTITLKGNYIDYFNNNSISNSSSVVENIAVSLNKSNNTEIKIKTSKLQGYEITSDSKYIYVKLGDPRSIYKNIVVLDPGHGGNATGTIQNGQNEKDINFNILYTIGKKYFNQDTSKLKVYYTRTSDVDMSLGDRAAFAKKIGADLFVSLHMNSAPNVPKASGTEVFYSSNNNTPNSAGLTSDRLASILLENLYPAIGTGKRGVKHENFTVIYRNTVPAVLIELGFLTNSSDYELIMDPDNQEIAADTIYNTLLKVFELYPTGR